MAISHAGGYVAGAFESGHAVGASFGFLADHHGERALHSHVTGILPGVQHGGVGRLMKNHQRAWAAERDIPWIVWTFDPLVRRNAWFNIEVLGGTRHRVPAELLRRDDRLDQRPRRVRPARGRLAHDATTCHDRRHRPAPITTTVATPDDIVVLRRTDPTTAADWRMRVRRELDRSARRRRGRHRLHPRRRLRRRINRKPAGGMTMHLQQLELRRIELDLVTPFRTSFGTADPARHPAAPRHHRSR